MAVYLQLSGADASTIACNYGLGALTGDPDPVDNGYNNSIFILHASTGDYVLKIYEPSIDPCVVTSLQERHDFQRFCFSHGIAVPELIGPVGRYKDKPFEITHRIDGLHMEHFAGADTYEIGKLVATFHQRAIAYPPFQNSQPPSGIKLLGSEAAGALKHAARARNPMKALRYAYTLCSAMLERIYAYCALPRHALPRGKIHGDINAENILRDRTGKFHLLDMERVNEGTLLNDVAQGIVRLCITGSKSPQLDRELIIQFLKGYRAIRPLTRGEAVMLPYSIYAQSRFYEMVSQKLALTGRRTPDIINPRQLKAELRQYDWPTLVYGS